ncbi:MAG: hypothetical protein K6F53_04805 [Lachnospiraceae bacterium]|nr:hypothetical protein [Lachnospiraceae bacterium]
MERPMIILDGAKEQLREMKCLDIRQSDDSLLLIARKKIVLPEERIVIADTMPSLLPEQYSKGGKKL